MGDWHRWPTPATLAKLDRLQAEVAATLVADAWPKSPSPTPSEYDALVQALADAEQTIRQRDHRIRDLSADLVHYRTISEVRTV